MRTMRRDAVPGAQPAQRRLRAWRDRRAPVPCALPSGAGPLLEVGGWVQAGVGRARPLRASRRRAGCPTKRRMRAVTAALAMLFLVACVEADQDNVVKDEDGGTPVATKPPAR